MIKQFVKGKVYVFISKELLDRAKYINLKKLKDFIVFYDKKIPPPKQGEV